MKIALLSFTNLTSGIGVIAHGLFTWLPANSILSIRGSKGRDRWTDRQLDIPRARPPFLIPFLRRFTPDAVIAVESMFDDGHYVYDQCYRRHIRTATIIMHESFNPGRARVDLNICPTRICFDRVTGPNKAYFELPFEIEQFPFTLRTQARRFLHIMGHGVQYNRRQTREVVAGFLDANIPNATLTVHCLQDWRPAYGKHHNPRVTFRRLLLPLQSMIYDGADVLIQPDSYAGFCLPLLEAQACGLPVITTDAPPMNEQVHDPAALVPVDRAERLETQSGSPTRVNSTQHLVTTEGVADAIRRVATGDVRAMSTRARIYALSRAWTEAKAEELRALLRAIPAEGPHHRKSR